MKISQNISQAKLVQKKQSSSSEIKYTAVCTAVYSAHQSRESRQSWTWRHTTAGKSFIHDILSPRCATHCCCYHYWYCYSSCCYSENKLQTNSNPRTSPGTTTTYLLHLCLFAGVAVLWWFLLLCQPEREKRTLLLCGREREKWTKKSWLNYKRTKNDGGMWEVGSYSSLQQQRGAGWGTFGMLKKRGINWNSGWSFEKPRVRYVTRHYCSQPCV